MKKLSLIILLAIPLLAASYRPAPALAQPEPTPTPPAVLLVNSTADPGDGVCDDAENAHCARPLPRRKKGATVDFSLAEESTITLVDGQLEIEKSLTIDGSTAPGLTVSGNNSSRVFRVFYTGRGNIKIKTITITEGFVKRNGQEGGGGIKNSAKLTLENVTIRNNRSEDVGGGIYNMGHIILVNSAISQNQAAKSGGGTLMAQFIMEEHLYTCTTAPLLETM